MTGLLAAASGIANACTLLILIGASGLAAVILTDLISDIRKSNRTKGTPR